ncbi:hypothetical protein D9619_009415 [Psilocybe cf. subviscida]|uniref:Uncharacterized protein n=1 Tax=Psilocybe cf. subviscida TaxID=2480587 RepID=A0A8H5BTJ6_9AGAR|nr:hypothetical protein D9619_009415 [Psilocybe cf. subviscida]
MNTNTNNPFQTTPVEKKTTTTTTTTGLGSPLDERAGDWASSTMSALGPDGSKTSASEDPFATHESTTSTAFGTTMAPSTAFPPTSASSTTTKDSVIDTNSIPLISPTIPSTTTTTHTNPSTHAPTFTSTVPHDAGLPGKLAVEPESFSRTTVTSVPSQGTYAPSGPAYDLANERWEDQLPSAATAYGTAKEVATLAKDVALAANEQMRVNVIPTVASYLPSAETTKQVAIGAGETAVAAGAVLGQAAYNAGSAAVEAAKPYMPTAEQTKDAAYTAGQATANAGATAGQAALGATVMAGQAAATGAIAAGQALSSGAAVAGQSVADGAAVAGQTVVGGAAVAGQTAANAGSAAVETTRNTGAAVADTTTNAAVSTKDGVASYIPEVHPINAVYNAAAAAGNAIRSYLPGATVAPVTSLPSQETSQNVHPSTAGGVGTLPGPPGEFGVAILPDEKTGGISTSQATAGVQPFASEHKPSHLGGVGTLPGAAGERGVAVLPEERNKSMLPSHDMAMPAGTGVAVLPGERGLPHPPLVQKALGETSRSTHTAVKPFAASTGGVGDLPGTPNESSVALLPEERLNKSNTAATVDPAAVPSSRSGVVSNIPGTDSKTGDTLPADERTKPTTTTASKPVNTSSSGSNTGPNVDGRSHPLTKAEEKVFGGHTHHELGSKDDSKVDTTSRGPAVPPKHQDTAEMARSHNDNKTSTHQTQPEAHDAATDVHRKPTFMDKVKGEAKVITGKMTHNEDKVEDGKKLMGKAIN